jgi:hypothetical protein
MIGAVKKGSLKKSKISFEDSQELGTKKLYNIERKAQESYEPELYESQWINEVHNIMKKNGYYPNHLKWGYSFNDIY